MHRSGLIQILRDRSVPKKLDDIGTDFSSVSLNEVTPILVVMATSVVTAILLLTSERLSFRKTQNQRKCYNKHKRTILCKWWGDGNITNRETERNNMGKMSYECP